MIVKSNITKICALLELEDEVTVCEMLQLTSEDLVVAFRNRIRENLPYLLDQYEKNTEKEVPIYRQSEGSRLGSKEVWENAGFDLEKESYE